MQRTCLSGGRLYSHHRGKCLAANRRCVRGVHDEHRARLRINCDERSPAQQLGTCGTTAAISQVLVSAGGCAGYALRRSGSAAACVAAAVLQTEISVVTEWYTSNKEAHLPCFVFLMSSAGAGAGVLLLTYRLFRG